MADAPTRPPKKTITPGARQEARALIYAHRGRLGVGLALMLVNRLAGLVLPSSSKWVRSEEHTSELQSQSNLVCRLLLEKKKNKGLMDDVLRLQTNAPAPLGEPR